MAAKIQTVLLLTWLHREVGYPKQGCNEGHDRCLMNACIGRGMGRVQGEFVGGVKEG